MLEEDDVRAVAEEGAEQYEAFLEEMEAEADELNEGEKRLLEAVEAERDRGGS